MTKFYTYLDEKDLPQNPKSLILIITNEKTFENVVGKGENAGNQHFLLFPHCFLPYHRQKSLFKQCIICLLIVLSI